MSGIAFLAPANAPASSTANNFVPLIGGLPGSPTTPTVKLLGTGFHQLMVVDSRGRFVYTVDGSGNLLALDLTSGATTPTQILTESAIGATIAYMVMYDSGTIWCATNSNTVLKISTAAPYTVTLVAGQTGVSGGADGTGAAATFGVFAGLAIDPVAGSFLTVYDNTIGGMRSVTTAGVVHTLFAGAGTIIPQCGLTMDTGGNLWYTFPEALAHVNNNVSGSFAEVSFPGSYVYPLAVDNYLPATAYVYLFVGQIGGGSALVRLPGLPGTSAAGAVTVATMPHQVNSNAGSGGSVSMCFRAAGLFVVDLNGNLYSIVG